MPIEEVIIVGSPGHPAHHSDLAEAANTVDSRIAAAVAVVDAAVDGKVAMARLAADPDLLIFGAITRNVDGAVTAAPVIWPDGDPGTFTATTLSLDFPGAIDSYTITKGAPVTQTYTQPTLTRNASGAVTMRPAIVVT